MQTVFSVVVGASLVQIHKADTGMFSVSTVIKSNDEFLDGQSIWAESFEMAISECVGAMIGLAAMEQSISKDDYHSLLGNLPTDWAELLRQMEDQE